MTLTKDDLGSVRETIRDVFHNEVRAAVHDIVRNEMDRAHKIQLKAIADIVGALADNLDDAYALLRAHLRASP